MNHKKESRVDDREKLSEKNLGELKGNFNKSLVPSCLGGKSSLFGGDSIQEIFLPVIFKFL